MGLRDPAYWLEIIATQGAGPDGTQTVEVDGPVQTIPAPGTVANTPAINTGAGEALAGNANRKVWTLQNLGTNALYVRLGSGATTSAFHFILKAGSAQDDGNGGFISDEIWKGVVSVAGTSPRFVALEVT